MKYTPWDVLGLMKEHDIEAGLPLHRGGFYHGQLRKLMNGIKAPYNELIVAQFLGKNGPHMRTD